MNKCYYVTAKRASLHQQVWAENEESAIAQAKKSPNDWEVRNYGPWEFKATEMNVEVI